MNNHDQAIKDVAEALKCTVDEVERDAFHCEIHAYAVAQRERVLELEAEVEGYRSEAIRSMEGERNNTASTPEKAQP